MSNFVLHCSTGFHILCSDRDLVGDVIVVCDHPYIGKASSSINSCQYEMQHQEDKRPQINFIPLAGSI